MKKGFGLITAIIFIVLLSTLGALALSLSTKSIKQTSDIYLQTQAELLAKSATEYAILAISAHDIDTTGNCLRTINAFYPTQNNPMFNITMNIRYFGTGFPGGCNVPANPALMEDNVLNANSNRLVQIDTVVTSANGISTEPIRFYKRTIQRP